MTLYGYLSLRMLKILYLLSVLIPTNPYEIGLCVHVNVKKASLYKSEHSFITFMSALLFRLMTVVLLAPLLASGQSQETANSLTQTRL